MTKSSEIMSGNQQRQSPVDIQSKDVCHDPNSCKASALHFRYVVGDCTHVTTSDGGWMVQVKNDCKTTLSAKHFADEFKLLQFHAHWGSNATHGSEHTIDGKPSSAEVHFVFWNTRYGSVDAAVQKGDGLAVIGVLLKENATTNPSYTAIVKCVEESIERKSAVELPNNFSIEQLLPPPESRDFYTYLGSLTTPPYSECVIWTVLKTPVDISAEQLNIFRRIIACNVRPCQAIGDRVVRASFTG